MANDWIMELVRELIANGIHITPRDERHTIEACAKLESLLNRLLRHLNRKCAVRVDALAMVVTLIE